MEKITIKWKDSFASEVKPIKYRNHTLKGYGGGWITDLPGDLNIYKNFYCAENAIDKALGTSSRKVNRNIKREKYGIQIIGKQEIHNP